MLWLLFSVFLASKLSQAMKEVDPEMEDGSDGDLSDEPSTNTMRM